MSSDAMSNRSDPMLGRVLLGRYRIVRELAKGGMGVVYLARAEGAAGFVKPVVVKLILEDLAADERFVGMFAREAQILANLRDPGIVDVIEFGKEDSSYVMVLEYVRGYHLGQWKRYLKRKGREIPTGIILQIIIDILQALHHAHTARHPDGESMHIVHRDVSPSNILLDTDGRARLLDFGVARMRGGTHGYKTTVKGFVGKYPYVAPEVFEGHDATPLSDLYSCAVVLHETLLGHNVFRANSEAATIHRVMNHDPEPVSAMRDDVPEALDQVLYKALSKDPKQRYQSGAELANALRALQPEPEHDVRPRLATILDEDFGEEMARMLGQESLAQRDEAWRRISQAPEPLASEPPTVAGAGVARDFDPDATVNQAGSAQHATPSTPEATVTRARSRRASAAGRVSDAPPVSREGASTPPRVPADVHPGAPAAAPRAASAAAWPGSKRRLWVALGAVVLVSGLATVAILRSIGSSSSQSLSGPIQVVQQPVPPQAEPEPSASPGGEETNAPEPGDEPAAAAAGTDTPASEEPAAEEPPSESRPTPSRERHARRRRGKGPDPAGLTRAFRRRQSEVQACISRHGEGLEPESRIQVEFSLAADGTLEGASVKPPAVASTAAGRCIERVARSTEFPAQHQPVVFTIPVTTRRIAQ